MVTKCFSLSFQNRLGLWRAYCCAIYRSQRKRAKQWYCLGWHSVQVTLVTSVMLMKKNKTTSKNVSIWSPSDSVMNAPFPIITTPIQVCAPLPDISICAPIIPGLVLFWGRTHCTRRSGCADRGANLKWSKSRRLQLLPFLTLST